jgi:phosphoadenosine phosphosulfate reductase
MDYTKKVASEEKTKLQNLPIDKKVEKAKEIIHAAMKEYGTESMSVAWTGGKDSTVVLWLVKQVCGEQGFTIPKCMFIDEGDVFNEIDEFVAKWARKWELTVTRMHNDDVSKQAGGKLGAKVEVAKLNEMNRKEIKRLGYKGKYFPYEPESFVGNHLMKTVMINKYLFDHDVKAFFEGIRWDEQDARADETYFSKRKESEYNPEHMRIFPILHFKEKHIWEAIHTYKIPYVQLYKQGYRSLGARVTTQKADEKPAWEQDFDKTTERAGRRQDKEGIMKRLRDLGYM